MTIPLCKITKHERAIFRELTRLNEQDREYGIIVCKDRECEMVIGDGRSIDIQGALSERWGAENLLVKLEGAHLYHNHPTGGRAILSPMDAISAALGGFSICAVSRNGDRMCAEPKVYVDHDEASRLLMKYDIGAYYCHGYNETSKAKQECMAEILKDEFDVCVGKLH